ncbi:hypothetical protein NP233_g5033 [Leucocoprinus birnbaumii]|uniref:Uncharacterized protein n=1 Tax=Leucocoprinus birnbaumii TaxID=56174 RepID=A0AAD5YWR9_9AGAR|nr:hypothetical protein NP233_g5033 [Leucocoprinus birnbaumii]
MTTLPFDITSGLPADMFRDGLATLPPGLFHQDANTAFSNLSSTTPPVLSALPSPMPPAPMLVNSNAGLSVPTPNLLDRFDVIHGMKNKRFGDQIKWVRKNLVRNFIKEFGPVSAGFAIEKGTHRVSAGKPAAVSTRAVQWVHVMGREMKDTVEACMNEIRESKGVTSKGDYLKHFKEACDEIIEELDQLKIDEFKAIADAETAARKSPPSPENVYEHSRQGSIVNVVSDAIGDNFGWEAGQVGDAICIFAIAYHDSKDQIKTDISFVSNKYIPNTDCNVPVIVSAFREHVNPLLKSLTNDYLPASIPQVLIDYENMTLKQLRGSLYEIITGHWVASSSESLPRSAETLPWVELATTEGREKYILDTTLPLFCKADNAFIIGGPVPFTPNAPSVTQVLVAPVAATNAPALHNAPSTVNSIQSIPDPVITPVTAAAATSAIPDPAGAAADVEAAASEEPVPVDAVDDDSTPSTTRSILGKRKRGNGKTTAKPAQVIYVPELNQRVLCSHADKDTLADQSTKETEGILEENQVLQGFKDYKKVIIPHVDDVLIGLIAPPQPWLSPTHPVDDILLLMDSFKLTD